MDIHTLLLGFSLINFLIFLFLLFYTFGRSNINSLITVYTFGKLFMGLAWILFYYRDQIPNIFSIVLANVLLIFGISIEVYAISSYSGKHKKFNSQLFFITGLIFALIFSLIANKNNQILVAFSSYLNSITFLVGFILLLIYKNRSRLHIFSTILFFYLFSVLFARGLAATFFLNSITLTSSGIIQNLTFSSFLLITFLSTILFLLLLKEKNDLVLKEKNIEIKKANELLAQSNKAKDHLFSIISHDLRGPIGSITNLCFLLVSQKSNLTIEDYKKFIPEIYKTSFAASDLLNNLLNWARLQLNNIVVNPTNFKLNHAANEVVNQMKYSIEQKQINIINNIDNNIEVYTDYEMLKVVMRNLLSNAIKFSSNSGKIALSTLVNGEYVTIIIKDDGIGIAPDTVKRLLDPEFYYTTAGTENEKGTGLGLKLSKDFIERNNGILSIESTPNKGSTFSFTVNKT